MTIPDPFFLKKDNIYAIPVVHYNMEMAAQVRLAFNQIQPDCVAVELAETMQLQLLHAASRLPDISVVTAYDQMNQGLHYLCEPCDPAFEGLRSAMESGKAAFCIDLDVDYYPDMRDYVPDPYAITRIGLKEYYHCYEKSALKFVQPLQVDRKRELHMAKRLKELSFKYERILFVGGMSHVRRILDDMEQKEFPLQCHAHRNIVELSTLTPEACRDVMAECGWFTRWYEELRQNEESFPPDRQRLIYFLYKTAATKYKESTGNHFPGYHMRNLMKFVRNYALMTDRLMPDLYQILSSAKGCVDHNFAYETWALATEYPFLKNIDGLPELNLSVEEIWKHAKNIRFHLKQPGRKNLNIRKHRSDKAKYQFKPPTIFGICSYQPEDKIIENFGDFLKKKGTQLTVEEASKTIPFSTSLEDGIDIKETLRHWYENKLYVKAQGKPPGGVGSVIVIFDEDAPEENEGNFVPKYPWTTTWIGEHQQESDMAFYATSVTANVVGPGISRCQYGGFLMSYPPRRMLDVWHDADYEGCRTKAEVLLVAGIDYSLQPLVVYVAAKPPRSAIKSFAKRFGKKIVYIPIGQLSPIQLNKMRSFHVLDGHDKRAIADEYIY